MSEVQQSQKGRKEKKSPQSHHHAIKKKNPINSLQSTGTHLPSLLPLYKQGGL